MTPCRSGGENAVASGRSTSSKRPIIIELVGHSGSGKTFLADQLVTLLRENHLVSREMNVTITDLLRFIVSSPRILIDLFRVVLAARPRDIKTAYKALSKLGLYQVKRCKALREGADVILFDEGMLHRLRMLRSSGRGKRLSYEDFDESARKRLFPKPDLVVFVVASLQTTAERRVKRGAAKGESVSAMVRRKRSGFSASIKATENDILAAQREQGFRAITVVNEDGSPVEANIRHILDEVFPEIKAARQPSLA